MNSFGWRSCLIAGSLAAIASVGSPVAAQEVKTVAGMIVNLGITPAAVALRAEGHREAHPQHFPSGSQHLLITLDDAKTHQRISSPEVVVEVTDPHGHVEKKPMLHTHGGGLPDYSELFVFGWSGKYTIRVLITPTPGAKPIEAVFPVDHVI